MNLFVFIVVAIVLVAIVLPFVATAIVVVETANMKEEN